MTRRRGSPQQRTVRQSMEEYGRGVAGGLLFSLPLLYTMEMWWAGSTTEPGILLLYVGLTMVLLLGYNRYAGMREDASWVEVGIDSIEEMGLGLVVAGVVLFVMRRITAEMPFREVMGRIIVESMTVAVGISVGTAQLGGNSDDTGAADAMDSQTQEARHPNTVAQIVLAFCGAVLFAANVAPTAEIQMIAADTATWRLVGLVVLSLVLGAGVLYFSGFVGAERFVRRGGPFWMIGGSMMSYAAALAAAALMVWFFHGFADVSPRIAVSQVVVLALPATLGASAGRLLIQ